MRTSPPLTDERAKEIQASAQHLRCLVVDAVAEAGSGHPGGSLSSADILALLFSHVLQLDPANPHWEERDRFVLAKGHAAPILYAALASRGFLPEQELQELRKLGSRLQGHPDRLKTPGVEASTGSLGQGLSIACGMALATRLDQRPSGVYVLLGDGELEEGQVWEAAMAAAHYKLDNLVAIVDYNGLQIDGPIGEVLSPEPIADKWRAFGWEVFEVDGHDIQQLDEAIRQAQGTSRPAVIIACTTKGKGVCFMENQCGWHGKAPTQEQRAEALQELREGAITS